MAKRISSAEARKRKADRAGLILISACLAGFAAMAYGAFAIDQARGITVSQSLAQWGIGRAPAARQVRLVGQCDGKILAAMEESDFPAGCAWIEPVKTESN